MIELPLTELRNGEVGIVSFLKAGHGRGHWRCSCFEKRLTDMGLTRGTEVLVVKSAPFYGPLEISVRGSRLACARKSVDVNNLNWISAFRQKCAQRFIFDSIKIPFGA